MDPIQWFYVLTGRDEGGAEHPSLILLLCKQLRIFIFVSYLILLSYLYFVDTLVPIVLCLITEKGLAVVSFTFHFCLILVSVLLCMFQYVKFKTTQAMTPFLLRFRI